MKLVYDLSIKDFHKMQQISLENTEHLSYTFYQMLELLSAKHKIYPIVCGLFQEEECIGYII